MAKDGICCMIGFFIFVYVDLWFDSILVLLENIIWGPKWNKHQIEIT